MRRLASRLFSPDARFATLALLTALPVVVIKWRALVIAGRSLLLAPGSSFSLVSLGAALLVAAASIALQRWARGRRLSWRLLRRALFPRWLTHSASTRTDLGYLLLNNLATGAMIGWALFSFPVVAGWTHAALVARLGPAPAPPMGPLATDCAVTVFMFLAYEFAYWLDHFLSHKVPLLWEFHRVHHTAETLSPLTVFRVHPVESLKFYNIGVLVIAPAGALAAYALGRPSQGWLLGGANVIFIALVCLTGHLQHSHVWIAFTGPLGRVFCSPAHHQLHHSANPEHFGRNLGSGLAVFDWTFGTLLMPTRQRQKLVFGVEPGQASPHTITGALVTPFTRAWGLRPRAAPFPPQLETIPPA